MKTYKIKLDQGVWTVTEKELKELEENLAPGEYFEIVSC